MNKSNFTLWGLPKGETDKGEEVILFTDCESEFDIEVAVLQAREQGYHALRVSVFTYQDTRRIDGYNPSDAEQASLGDAPSLGYSVKPQRKSLAV